MGLPGYVAGNVEKYRAAGGIFRNPSDFSRIYGMSDSAYARMEPYITISDTLRYERRFTSSSRRDLRLDSFVIDINKAGEKEFLTVHGIGTILSARIIKYRDLLGGFTTVDQLSEVYGLSDSLVTANRMHFVADTACIRKISLNGSTYATLIRHPYLRKEDVAALLRFREYSREDISPEILGSQHVLSDSVMRKIRPYLTK